MKRTKQAKEKIVWDGIVKGLGFRTRGVSSSWILQTRIRGRQVKRVVGDGKMPRPEAREKARRIIDELKASVEGKPETLVTVEEFGKRYIADKSSTWAAATIGIHQREFTVNINPWLGTKRVSDVARVDVINWLDDMSCAPGSKNRAMAVLSGMMRHAELLDLRPPGSNPCKGLRRRKVSFKATYLTKTEFGHLGQVFRSLENQFPVEVSVLRFLALTGCRKREALGLQWVWLDGSRFALPNSKSGPRSIWLGKAARALVARQEKSLGFVFAKGGEPVTAAQLDLVWRLVRKRSEMPRLRIHDLRHSFASVSIGNGIGLRTLAGLLGHRDLGSTAAYAHLQEDALKASVARVGAHMSSLLAIKDPTPKSYRQVRVVDGVMTDGLPKRGPKPKPKPVPVKVVVRNGGPSGKDISKPGRTPAQLRADEKTRERAEAARMRKEAERVKKQAETMQRVQRFLKLNVGLPEFCAIEGLNQNRFRNEVIAYREAKLRKVAA